MNSQIASNSIRFVILVLAQVLIFNHIDLLGYINPYPYILFIALLPFNASKVWVVLFSFLIGSTIDIFSDGAGVNTIACLVTGYTRFSYLRVSFGIAVIYNTIKIQDVSIQKSSLYFALLVLTHHLIIYFLEIFSFTAIGTILKKTVYSGVFTLVLCILFVSIFNRRK